MKKVLFVAAVIFAIGLVTTSLAQTKVLSGTWSANTNTAGYTLAENEGERSITISVNFLDPFEEKPDVTLGLTLLDASAEKNLRYRVEALSVSRDAMTIKVSTWANTKIYGIAGYWMAHGK